jgi:Gas vesicle synthesis protein GvpL/GvpF
VVEPAGAVYVYGVTPKAQYTPVSTHGVEDAEIETVEHDGLVALASRLQNGKLAARDVRAHWRVLEHAFESAAVLPVRFGTVMESEEAVRVRLLAANAGQLSGLLQQMTGLAQLNLKGQYDEERLLREIVAGTPSVAQMRERMNNPNARFTQADQLALGQLVEREVGRHQAQDADAVLQKLEPLAVAARAEEVSHPNAFNLAFLVERAHIDGFSDAVHGLRERFGDRIELRYVGPVPPFSFVEADLNIDG